MFPIVSFSIIFNFLNIIHMPTYLLHFFIRSLFTTPCSFVRYVSVKIYESVVITDLSTSTKDRGLKIDTDIAFREWLDAVLNIVSSAKHSKTGGTFLYKF